MEPKMTCGLYSAMMTEILSDFDFEKVRAVIVLLGITFPDPVNLSGPRHIPSVDELKAEAVHLLEEAWDERARWTEKEDSERVDNVCCGCLSVDITWEAFELKFHPVTSASYFGDHGEADGIPDEKE